MVFPLCPSQFLCITSLTQIVNKHASKALVLNLRVTQQSHTRQSAYQILTLLFITVAKCQVSCNNASSFTVGVLTA